MVYTCPLKNLVDTILAVTKRLDKMTSPGAYVRRSSSAVVILASANTQRHRQATDIPDEARQFPRDSHHGNVDVLASCSELAILLA
ncbi:hypothetical protein WS83_14940 [Burkholderia sp. MSMB2042]|nr:hypothetical protein WS78_31850 [Burkholderia savannae]KVG42319.1 hypothetical protein WS77_14545 [Burkholderia sp. MSMB0265]KVG90947.1 hypothetical protein WS83_14940 [Burkholderia sp. MSMB2042]KVH01146.1 hypothetical protein WS82_22305 [Burkholderia sp. MSMB2041]KVK85500.1 hypothetical protein WS91_03680 [Burkholderia sp. MSMB1498]